MIPVETALAHLFSLVAPLGVETVPLGQAAGRVLAEPVAASRDQPPFAASAMDGYAVCAGDAQTGATLDVIGEAAAGHGWPGTLSRGQAVRIFTGAPVPDGADAIVLQEDVRASNGCITITDTHRDGTWIRAAGGDFRAGDTLDAPRRLGPSDVALLAAMNCADVPVRRAPVVALIATGNELVMPGEMPGPDQIVSSNAFGLAAVLRELGAEPRLLPIARDTTQALHTVFDLAQGADLIVTIGGASVGDHDLVGEVAAARGMERAFYKVAMRPGKPLMAGRMDRAALVGLPGNPVSALVCGHVFVAPMVRLMLGLGAHPAPRLGAVLAVDLPENGPREHYMRARLTHGQITPDARQDSSLLSVLAHANALLVRPPGDPARAAGTPVDYVPL
ncbi:MAG: gephyrin-like molybdotransferase Glp [Pseudomonadota bacterium]